MACLWDIDEWIFTNRLGYPDKTRLTCSGTREQLVKINIKHVRMGNTDIPIGSSATSLGVHLDSGITMLPHIQHISKTCYHQLRSCALFTDHYPLRLQNHWFNHLSAPILIIATVLCSMHQLQTFIVCSPFSTQLLASSSVGQNLITSLM